MRASAIPVVAALAALAAACTRAPEAEHLDRVRALCAELADRGAGASEAESVFGAVSWIGCGTDFPPGSADDRCPQDGSTICIRVWAFRATHPELCGGTGCSYGCELRAPEGSPEATCAVRFVDGTLPVP